MGQDNRTFIERYALMEPTERNRLNTKISERCNVSLWTIQSWSTGRRIPKPASRAIIAELMDTKSSILFPHETSIQPHQPAAIA